MRRLLASGGALVAVLMFCSCEEAFLHDVDSRKAPTDTGGCTPPDGGAASLSAAVFANRVELNWESEASNADGFLIERKSSAEDIWGERSKLAPDERSYSDFEIGNDLTYTYRVTAYRVTNNETCSSTDVPEVEVLTFPGPVEQLSAQTLSAHSIILTWHNPNSLGSPGCRVERRTDPGDFTELTITGPTAVDFADNGLDAGTTYEYRLTVINDSGESLPREISERTSAPPQLSWTTAPRLEAGCRLEVFGQASFDEEKNAQYESASAIIDKGSPAPDAQADVNGFWGVLTDISAGDFDTTWTVVDNQEGTASLSRRLSLEISTMVRTPPRLPTLTIGDSATAGQQAMLPTCSTCTGSRGSVVAGLEHTCLLTDAGTVKCWGGNAYGQLGTGVPSMVAYPTGACAGGFDNPCGAQLADVVELSLGEDHGCALASAGTLKCWGSNLKGKLGGGDILHASYAVDVCIPGAQGCQPIADVAAVAAGEGHTCAVVGAAREVMCWGSNYYGQLGVGTENVEYSGSPVYVCASGSGAGCPRLGNIADLAAGRYHTCALDDTGRVWCWGYNYYGQVGKGDNDYPVLNPSEVCLEDGGAGCTSLPAVTSVAAGGDFSCAVTGTQTILCWGCNYDGQLGTGDTSSRVMKAVPVCADIDSGCNVLGGVDMVAAGEDHACALLGDQVKCWGSRDNGRVGDGDTSAGTRLLPVSVCASGSVTGGDCTELSGVVSIHLGWEHSCARLTSAEVVCWGNNSRGQLGDGNSGSDAHHYNPAPVCSGPPNGGPCTPLADVALIAGGYRYACAASGGAVFCWGEGGYGQLGFGNPSREANPVDACTQGFGLSCVPLDGVVALDAGGAHTCALHQSGGVKCWGYNYTGQVGNGADCTSGCDPVETAVDVCARGESEPCQELLENVVAISCGWKHTCALLDTGGIACWGNSHCGQLGTGTVGTCSQFEHMPVSSPVDVCAVGSSGGSCEPLAGSVSVNAGGHMTCALTATGSVICWGNNQFGQVGDGTIQNIRATPVYVCATGSGEGCPALAEVVAVVLGYSHTCALMGDGTAQCWGHNHCGQLGNGLDDSCIVDSTFYKENPTRVCESGFGSSCPPLAGIVSLAAGDWYTCALNQDGEVYCWGDGWFGTLGNGSRDPVSNPVGVCLSDTEGCGTTCSGALTDSVGISAGGYHVCGLTATGTVRCWGDSAYGKLGNGLVYRSIEDHQCNPVDVCAFGTSKGCPSGSLLDNAAFQTCDVRSIGVAP